MLSGRLRADGFKFRAKGVCTENEPKELGG